MLTWLVNHIRSINMLLFCCIFKLFRMEIWHIRSICCYFVVFSSCFEWKPDISPHYQEYMLLFCCIFKLFRVEIWHCQAVSSGNLTYLPNDPPRPGGRHGAAWVGQEDGVHPGHGGLLCGARQLVEVPLYLYAEWRGWVAVCMWDKH